MPAYTAEDGDAPFLRLPGELQNHIYRFALVSEAPLTCDIGSHPMEDHDSDSALVLVRQHNKAYPEISALLHTCHEF